jgi:hypothetical protein
MWISGQAQVQLAMGASAMLLRCLCGPGRAKILQLS